MSDQRGPWGQPEQPGAVPPVPPAPGQDPAPQGQPAPIGHTGGFLPPQQLAQPAQPGQPGQPGSFGQPAQFGQPEQFAQPGQPAPAGPKPSRRKLAIILGSVGAVLLLLIVGGVVAFSTLAAQHAPDRAVRSYLDALVAGKASDALDQLAVKPDGDTTLLSDAVYAEADDRVTGYEVLSTATSGDEARVTVKVTTGSGSTTERFSLRSTGRDLLWSTWGVDGSQLDTITVDFPAPEGIGLEVNGVELDAEALTGDVALAAFPGSYAFEPAGQLDYIAAEPQSATVATFGSAPLAQRLDIVPTLTEAGTTAARASLDAFLDACIAQPVYEPTGRCGYRIVGDSSVLTSISWTIRQRPVASFGAFDGVGFPVVTDTLGIFDMAGSGPRWTSSGTIDAYDYRGTVTVAADGTAVFTSDYQD